MPEAHHKTFIIAELSANHNNDFDLAVKTVEAMAASGANAVKVQTYTPDSLTLNVDNEYFGPKKDGLWKGKKPYDLFKEGSLPYDWHPELKKIAEGLGLTFFSSPFDKAGVDFLESINVPLYKVASLEITDIPLIAYIASKGKPMIISTGAAELADIELAIKTCREKGNDQITLLKCTSEYPAPIEKANLLTIPNLKATFGVEVGVSDHTMGSTVPVVSVALGATVIEKHFILNRSQGGPDAAFSMEPTEFEAMIKAVREAESAMGEVTYALSAQSKLRRRSLFAVNNINPGEKITEENVRAIRPGYGLHPKYYQHVLGKTARTEIKKGDPLSWGMFQD